MADTESAGTPGPATDRLNAPVRDPSGNVLDLVEAAITRQDDLRNVEAEHTREILRLRSLHAQDLRKADEALINERLAGVQREQALIESHRIELKGDSEKALTAALSAQKEAAAEQNKSNTLAIDKAVSGMKELIVNNYQISQATTNALSDKVEDLKASVAILVNTKIGATEVKQEQRAVSAGVVALIGLGSAILFGIVGAVLALVLR